MKQEVIDYVNSTDCSKSDKNDFILFCKKQEYLDRIMNIMFNTVKCKINYGYGNLNSDICFLFSDINSEEAIKKELSNILKKYGIDYYSVYVTYIKKCDNFYGKYLELLYGELNAINAKIIYYFGENEDEVNLLKDLYIVNNKTFNYRYINIKDFKEDNIKSEIKYMIKYKNILRRN
jgi:hypothetical protein